MHSEPLFRSALIDGASRYGITLNDSMVLGFKRYTALLREWNSRMNLVSARDMDRFLEYHLLDSLKVASVFDFSSIRTLLDFGSGAGLPGIPLSLVFPHLRVVLLDSREKRWAFLDEAVRAIPLPNASATRSRLEELPLSSNQTFDGVITRATVSLSDFYRLAGRLISPGGSLIAIKGDSIDEEYQDLLSMADSRVFNIRRTTPKPVSGVRSGQVVIITRTVVINKEL